MTEQEELEQLMPPGLMDLLDYARSQPKEATTYAAARPPVIHLPDATKPGE